MNGVMEEHSVFRIIDVKRRTMENFAGDFCQYKFKMKKIKMILYYPDFRKGDIM